MRRLASIAAIAALLAAAFAGYRYIKANDPARPAVIVGGNILSVGELELRAQTVLADARRAGRADVGDAALAAFRRDAARMWIVKEVLLAEAERIGVKPTKADVKEQMMRSEAKLRKLRKITMEQFFKEGPLPEEVKRRDFDDVVKVSKLVSQLVRDRIVVTPEEVEARISDTKKDRKEIIDEIRAERYNVGFRRLFRSLYPKVAVKCPAFPEMEKLEGVSPSRPEDKESGK